MTKREFIATTLRDAALHHLKHHGDERVVSGIPMIEARVDGLHMVHWSRPLAGAYHRNIDVYAGNPQKKVLNFGWDEAGNIHIVTFRRGDWEAKLLALSGPQVCAA